MSYNVTVSGKEYEGIDKVKIPITGENTYAEFHAGSLEDFIAGNITSFESDFDFSTNVFYRAYAFYGQTKMTRVSIPSLKVIPTSTFEDCESLTDVNLPAAEVVGISAFIRCKALEELVMQSAKTINTTAFHKCIALRKADFPVCTSIGNNALSETALEALILRADKVCTLSNTSTFNTTPIASGTGYIYVPSALVDSYKTAANWSAYADQFRAIEDYPDICG